MQASPKVFVLALLALGACKADPHDVPSGTDEDGDALPGDSEGDGDAVPLHCNGTASYLHVTSAQTLDPLIEDAERCLLYGLDRTQNALFLIDTANDEVREPVAIGQTAVDLTLSADKRFVYVALAGETPGIARFHADTGVFDASVATSLVPYRIARGPNERVYYVEEAAFAALHQVDFQTQLDEARTLTDFHEPDLEATSDGLTLYLGESSQLGSRLFRFDASVSALPEIEHFRFDGGFTLPSPERQVFVAQEAQRVFWADRSFEADDLSRMRGWFGGQVVASTSDGKIVATHESIYDGRTFVRVANRLHPHGGAMFSSDGAWLYEFDALGSLLHRTRVTTLIGIHPLGETVVPAGSLSQHDFLQVVADPVRPLLYALDTQQNQIVIIDRDTLLPKHAELVGSAPTDMALSADGNELVLATFGATELAVLDLTRTDKQLKEVIFVPGNPFKVALSSQGIIAYAEQDQYTDVTLVERATGEVLDNEANAIFQPDVEFDASGQYLYTGESSGPDAHLSRFDVSVHELVAAGVASEAYSYPTRRVIHHAGKVYFAGRRFDASTLEDEGSYGEDILLVTPDGRFAVSRRHVFDAETFQEVDGLPVDSGIIAADPDGSRLFQFDNETGALFVQGLPSD